MVTLLHCGHHYLNKVAEWGGCMDGCMDSHNHSSKVVAGDCMDGCVDPTTIQIKWLHGLDGYVDGCVGPHQHSSQVAVWIATWMAVWVRTTIQVKWLCGWLHV